MSEKSYLMHPDVKHLNHHWASSSFGLASVQSSPACGAAVREKHPLV